MKARLFTLLIALLAIVTGAKAQKIDPIVVPNTLELELYSGEEIPEVGIKLLVLFAEKAGLIVRQDGQGGAIFYKGKKELFNIKVRDGEGRVTVPTDVTWEQNPDPVRVTQAELQELGITGDYSRMSVVFSVTINSINFTDGTFRTYVSENFDTNLKNKGRLTKAEAEVVTEINVRRKGITSLKGVEYFTKLTKLECGSNQLTSLDVTKNTALTELDCYSNQLTSLDVTENTALTGLRCYSNQLTSLDVSKNTALTDLDCSGNQLTTLDVSNNTALTVLECANNHQLTSLDVTKNTVLWYLYCYGNLIRGKGMTDLVKSLPDRSSASEEGELYVYRAETPAGNLMTPQQVEVATSKNWDVYLWDADNWEWVAYEGETLPGDANGDGEVNALDVDCLRDYILGLNPQPFSLESANLNGDSAVDIQDLTLLIEMLTEE